MGQAFDRDGNVLGEADGDTKRDVFEKLVGMAPDAHEIRIKSMRDKLAEIDASSAGHVEPTLEQDIASALNRHRAENGSNTPDFLLAQYLLACLSAFNQASTAREKWYGKELSIGGGSCAAPANSPEPLALMRQFAGWLSADIPELHHVEVPRLAESLDRFLAAAAAAR